MKYYKKVDTVLLKEITWCLEGFIAYCESKGLLDDDRACQPKNEAIDLLNKLHKIELKEPL